MLAHCWHRAGRTLSQHIVDIAFASVVVVVVIVDVVTSSAAAAATFANRQTARASRYDEWIPSADCTHFGFWCEQFCPIHKHAHTHTRLLYGTLDNDITAANNLAIYHSKSHNNVRHINICGTSAYCDIPRGWQRAAQRSFPNAVDTRRQHI